MATGRSSSMTDRIARQYEQQFGRVASANDPQYAAYVQSALPQMIASDKAALERSRGRWKTADKFAWIATALPFAAAAAPLVMGAGAAAGGGAAAAGTTAGGVSTATAAGLPLMRLTELGVGAGMNLYANHQANKASDRAAQIEDAAARRNEALLREQMAEDRARWDADQEQARLDRLAADEERAYTRSQSDAFNARRAPFRAVGRGALMSLANIAGIHVDPSAYEVSPNAYNGSGVTVPRTQPAPVNRAMGSSRAVVPPGQMPVTSRLIPLSQIRHWGNYNPAQQGGY